MTGRLLVVGGAGNLSASIVKALIDAGHKVVLSEFPVRDSHVLDDWPAEAAPTRLGPPSQYGPARKGKGGKEPALVIFPRFAVIRRDTREPIEGCVYTDYFKARKRLRGLADAGAYEVVPVSVVVADGGCAGVPRPLPAAVLE